VWRAESDFISSSRYDLVPGEGRDAGRLVQGTVYDIEVIDSPRSAVRWALIRLTSSAIHVQVGGDYTL
jgi:hypothetical protein